MKREEFIPNDRLRRARSLKGWSQADLAAEVGTSFEMVSRWERGATIPSPYFRERLCAALGQSAEELGLVGGHNGSITPPSSPLVLLASSHIDAEKPVVFQIKAALQDRGITLRSSRQLGRQGSENSRTALHGAVHSALFLLVIVSPEARTSRHVREALEMASMYQLPVYGVWIEGERWQEYLPADSVERVVPIDARMSNTPLLIEKISTALARVGLTSSATSTTTSLPAGKASPPSGALAGRFDIAEYANSLQYDPDDSYLMTCDQIPPNGANFTFYCNPALDSLYKQELATVEPGPRQQIFLRIHEIFLTQLPFIVLYSPTELAIVHKGTHNYQPSTIEGSTISIWQWWCDHGQC